MTTRSSRRARARCGSGPDPSGLTQGDIDVLIDAGMKVDPETARVLIDAGMEVVVLPTETPNGNHWDRLEDAIAYMKLSGGLRATSDIEGWDVIAASIVDALGRQHCDYCQIGADVDFDEAGVHVWGVHECDCPDISHDEPTITRVHMIDRVGHPA